MSIFSSGSGADFSEPQNLDPELHPEGIRFGIGKLQKGVMCITHSGEKLDADRALNSTLQVITRNGVEVSTTVKTISLSGCYRYIQFQLFKIATFKVLGLPCHFLTTEFRLAKIFQDQSKRGAFLYFHAIFCGNELLGTKKDRKSLNRVPIFYCKWVNMGIKKSVLYADFKIGQFIFEASS
jgi:hypothetical protein